MERKRIQKFTAMQDALQCPLCEGALSLDGSSLRCPSGHCFDISSKGTVNLLPHRKASIGYGQSFFESRRAMFEEGLYDHVIDGVRLALERNLPRAGGARAGNGGAGPRPSASRRSALAVDVGCGEGFYAKALAGELLGKTPLDPAAVSEAGGIAFAALDCAKEAIQVAARGGGGICWLVSDLAKLPFRNGSVDFLLNIFTPANYAEFSRVLAPAGLLLKVVPGARHFEEVRAAARGLIRHDSYSNQQVVDHFEEFFHLKERIPLRRTLPIAAARRADLLRMTPLLFGVDERALDGCDVPRITVDAELLVGCPITKGGCR